MKGERTMGALGGSRRNLADGALTLAVVESFAESEDRFRDDRREYPVGVGQLASGVLGSLDPRVAGVFGPVVED
jgi:hypothetical protein